MKTIRIYKGIEGFRALEPVWESLPTPYYFLEHTWHEHAVVSTDQGECVFVCLYVDDVLVAILPLQQTTREVFRVKLCQLGFYHPDYMYIHGFVRSDAVSHGFKVEDIVRALKREGIRIDMFLFRRIYSEADIDAILERKWRNRAIVYPAKSSIIRCRGSFDDYVKQLSKNRRQKIGQKARRLEKLGSVGFQVIADERRSQAVEDYIDLEAKGWKGSDGNAVKRQAVHAEYYRSTAQLPQTVIFQYQLNEKTIASQIAILSAGVLFVRKTTYDEDYAKYSPGELLLFDTVRHCFENGIETINLVTDLDWHRHLSNDARPLNKVYVYPRSVRSSALYVAHLAKLAIRKLRVKMKGSMG